MKKVLTPYQKRWLRFAHIFFAALWGGGAVAMVMIFCLIHPQTVGQQLELSKILICMDFIIVGPGALGCLATGIVYSVYMKFGFIKIKWITIKYIINLVFILYGSLIFLPFTHNQYLSYKGLPYNTPVPEESFYMNVFCTMQNFCTIFMFIILIYISVFKPFKNAPNQKEKVSL